MTPLYFFFLGRGVGGFVSWGYFSSVGDGTLLQISFKLEKLLCKGEPYRSSGKARSFETNTRLLYNIQIIMTPLNNESKETVLKKININNNMSCRCRVQD